MGHSTRDRAGAIRKHRVVVTHVDDLDVRQVERGIGLPIEICHGESPLVADRRGGARGGSLELRAGSQAHRLTGRLFRDDRLS